MRTFWGRDPDPLNHIRTSAGFIQPGQEIFARSIVERAFSLIFHSTIKLRGAYCTHHCTSSVRRRKFIHAGGCHCLGGRKVFKCPPHPQSRVPCLISTHENVSGIPCRASTHSYLQGKRIYHTNIAAINV